MLHFGQYQYPPPIDFPQASHGLLRFKSAMKMILWLLLLNKSVTERTIKTLESKKKVSLFFQSLTLTGYMWRAKILIKKKAKTQLINPQP